MPRHYIEAYDADGRSLLGNLDGQASFTAKQPHKTNHWKLLNQFPVSKRVAYWVLTDEYGKHLARKERTV